MVAENGIAAAMAAHVDAQHPEPALQQRRHLLGPAAAVRGQRMGDADGRRIVGPDQVIGDMASLQRQQHGIPPPVRYGPSLWEAERCCHETASVASSGSMRLSKAAGSPTICTSLSRLLRPATRA